MINTIQLFQIWKVLSSQNVDGNESTIREAFASTSFYLAAKLSVVEPP